MKTLALIASLAFGTALSFAAETKDAGLPATYPLKTCVISGRSLGEMGKPFKASHDGTDVYLCCKSCLKDFNKDPAKHTATVKAAQTK